MPIFSRSWSLHKCRSKHGKHSNNFLYFFRKWFQIYCGCRCNLKKLEKNNNWINPICATKSVNLETNGRSSTSAFLVLTESYCTGKLQGMENDAILRIIFAFVEKPNFVELIEIRSSMEFDGHHNYILSEFIVVQISHLFSSVNSVILIVLLRPFHQPIVNIHSKIRNCLPCFKSTWDRAVSVVKKISTCAEKYKKPCHVAYPNCPNLKTSNEKWLSPLIKCLKIEFSRRFWKKIRCITLPKIYAIINAEKNWEI